MTKQQFGVIGMAVMGKNLAMNIESRGYSVSVYNRSREKTDDILAETKGRNFKGTYSIEEFVESLESSSKNYVDGKSRSTNRCDNRRTNSSFR